MKAKTKQTVKRVHDRLVNVQSSDKKNGNYSYVTMDTLTDTVGVSKSTIYRCVRLLREQGIGVYYRSSHGYILSEFAQKSDDVNNLRRIHGRRTSDMLNLDAAQQWLKKRFTSDWEKRQLSTALRPLLPERKLLDSSSRVLLRMSNGLGL